MLIHHTIKIIDMLITTNLLCFIYTIDELLIELFGGIDTLDRM